MERARDEKESTMVGIRVSWKGDEKKGLTCVEKVAFLPFVTRIRHGYSFSLTESASPIVASSPS